MATTADELAEIQYEEAHAGETHVAQLLVVFVISIVIGYSAVGLRLLCRRIGRIKLGWDDWIIISSLLFLTGFVVPNCVFTKYGFGRHQILVKDPIALSKMVLVAEIVYTMGILAFKASALCLLGRIFPGRRFAHLLWAVGLFVLAYSLTQTFAIIGTCVPIEAIWNPKVEGRCININDVYLVCSAFNIATDVVILAVPMPKLWKLKISTTQKVQLTLFFALGSSVCIISIVRTTQLKKVSLVDPAYSDYGPVTLSALEMAFGTLSACLPTYRPILHWVFDRKTLLSGRGTKQTSGRGIKTVITTEEGSHDTDTSTLHPFARLHEDTNTADPWVTSIPLSSVNRSSIAGLDAPARHERNHLRTDQIRVQTDLEQTSV